MLQAAPAVSLTDDGGLVLEWLGAEIWVDVTLAADRKPEVFVRLLRSGEEWEGAIWDCPHLDKWLWHASSPRAY